MRTKLGRANRAYFHLIAAIAAASLVGLQACGDDFENCAATRTCPLGDEGGDGGDAPSHTGAMGGDRPSAGGSGTATSGSAGEASGIGGEPAGAFDVVSTTPGNSANGVERDAVVGLTFSSNVDAASVTTQTVKLTGPSGDLEGKLKVDGATVTFTPSKPFALLADYQVTVAPSVAASDGTKLGVVRHFDFQSRDGVFRKPQRLSSDKAIGLDLQGTRSGYAAVTWSDDRSPASPYATMFDPATASWSKVAPLESDTIKDYGSVSVCLNERGEAPRQARVASLGSATAFSCSTPASPAIKCFLRS